MNSPTLHQASEAGNFSIAAVANGPIVFERNGHAFANSRDVAAFFGKRHADVMRAVENLGCSPHFTERNFAFSEYVDSTGRALRCCAMTKDGFTFLVMGFTGPKAAAFKEAYIERFNAMDAALRRQERQQATLDLRQARTDGKVIRLSFTDGIKEFVEYAKAQGSKSASMYYINLTKMEYKALFMIDGELGTNFRDRLSAVQNIHLATAESIAQRALRDGMARQMPYKAIFALARDRVEAFAQMVGKSAPGIGQQLSA